MESVLGFVKYDRARPVDDLVGDLLAAVGGKAVEDDRAVGRSSQEDRVHLIRREDQPPRQGSS